MRLSDFIKDARIVDTVISTDEFDEIGEFSMPLEKDAIMNVNINNELRLLEEFGCKLEV